jgi:hypothetical protein
MEENKIPGLIIHWMNNKATASELLIINGHLQHKMAALKLNDGIRDKDASLIPRVIDPEIIGAINAGAMLLAVKMYKDETGFGLKEAKDAIDFIKARKVYQDKDYNIKYII